MLLTEVALNQGRNTSTKYSTVKPGNHKALTIKIPKVENTLFKEKEYKLKKKEYELSVMAYELEKLYKQYYNTALYNVYTYEQISNPIDENLINKTREYQDFLNTVTADEKNYMERYITELQPDYGYPRQVKLEMSRFYPGNIKTRAFKEFTDNTRYIDKNGVEADNFTDYIALSGNKAWLYKSPFRLDFMVKYKFYGTYNGISYSYPNKGITYRQLIDKIIENKKGKVAQSEIDNYIEIRHLLIEKGVKPKTQTTITGTKLAFPEDAGSVPITNRKKYGLGGSRKKRNSKSKKSRKNM